MGRGRRLEVPALISTCQTFTGGIEAVFPIWLAANLDEDVAAHEVLDGISKTAFVIQQRRVVEVPSVCEGGQWFTFDETTDNGSIPC